jgi:two-component system LytT family response regulator
MIKLLIVDDEKPAREVIKTYLAGRTDIIIVGEAEDGREAIEIAQREAPDLGILDMQMPEMNGIQTAAALPEGMGIIFITAFDTFAIQAFELHAFDYILKPVMKPRLLESIDRFIKIGSQLNAKTLLKDYRNSSQMELIKNDKANYIDRLTIRTMFEYMVVKAEYISCIKVEDGLVFVYSEGIKYNLGASLKRLEERLDPAMFVRVHRNAIVNKNFVKRIYPWQKGHYRVELEDGEHLDLSRENLKRFKHDMGWDV